MKRGKRQVIESKPQQQGTSSLQQLEQSNTSYFTNLATNTIPMSMQQKPQLQQTVTIKPISTASQIISLQTQQKGTEQQQRRKRVQLLKQKYMKKSDDMKVQTSKTANNIPATFCIEENSQQKVQPVKTILANSIPVADNLSYNSNGNYNVHLQDKINYKSVQAMKPSNPYQTNTFKAQSQIVETNNYECQNEHSFLQQQQKILNTRSQEICNQNDSYQDVTQQNELTAKSIPYHDVPKPPAKHHFKNPPPPPHFKKPPQHNNQTETENTQNQSKPIQSIPVTTQQQSQTILQKMPVKPLPPSSFIAKSQLLSSNSSKSQKQDNKSFAPPSTITPTDKFQTVQQNRVPPPPPPNRNMKDLLNKKLSSNKTNVPKPPQRIIQQQVKQNMEENGFGDGFSGCGYDTSIEVSHNNVKSQKNAQIDDQYNNFPPSSSNYPTTKQPIYQQQNYPNTLQQQSKQQSINSEKYISEWLTSPQLTLTQLHPEMKQAIEFYCLNKHLTLNLSSNNPSFTPLIKQFIESFVMNNLISYSEAQKLAAESVCMTFFYTNAAEFSDIFLVTLVKLGGQYLGKYQQALEDQFAKYLQKILMYKNVFLPEEINQFVKFCLDCNIVNQENSLLFLMLTSQTGNNQLLQFVSQSEIHQLSNNLSILSYCQLNLKNKIILPLYLKTISNLQSQWIKYKMVEKILNHLKSVDIPENLYQYTKQLKLKLLKNYESNGTSHNEQQKYNNDIPVQSMNSQQQTNKDTGLFGLFNINKAIDKIKTSTEKALGAVQKQKKPQQEEKKDEIVYDPIRKRYIINGQIPEDDNQPSKQEAQQQKVKIPPPPPMGVKKPPPPMPGKKPGNRIATNRYA